MRRCRKKSRIKKVEYLFYVQKNYLTLNEQVLREIRQHEVYNVYLLFCILLEQTKCKTGHELSMKKSYEQFLAKLKDLDF